MPATELLCQMVGINPNKLSKEENLILEAELFTQICEHLKEIFKTGYKGYFYLIKYNTVMENTIMEAKLLRCIIKDILSTEEYTLTGIAYYTQIPEEVIYEIAMGINSSPSAIFFRRIIELHKSIRPDLYRDIIKKITTEYNIA